MGRELAQECIEWSSELWGHWERIVPFLDYFGKRTYCLPKTKEPIGTSHRLFISRVERIYFRAEEQIQAVPGPLRHGVLSQGPRHGVLLPGAKKRAQDNWIRAS